MHHFDYRKDALYAEDVALERIAREVGTPTYVYSQATLERHYRVVDEAFAALPHLLCYSVKANSTLGILSLLARQGSGFDIVSGGELYRALKAGGDPKRIVFSGVGKTDDEIAMALDAQILMFNVESEDELEAIARVAKRRKQQAPVALRVNPDVDARTHPYIATGLKESKFGIPMKRAAELYRAHRRSRALSFIGVDCHIGSQMTEIGPVTEAVRRVGRLYATLQGEGLPLRYLDAGGGLGITYSAEKPPSPAEYANAVAGALKGLELTLILEPGRVLVGNAGLLLSRVVYNKQNGSKRFVVVDAGMNDLIRPALYGAHHEILPVRKRAGRKVAADLVGPVCESSDAFARKRPLPPLENGQLVALMSAGAYGMSMASNYNSRPRPAEVLVHGRGYTVIRERERLEDLVRGERVLGAGNAV
ncbi:MAG: diaminopimelate decarboxylase [Myxococcales bacterium]